MKRGLLGLLTILVAIVCTINLKTIGPEFAYAEEASPPRLYPNMVVEWLKIKVAPEKRDLYVDIDNQIWTPALAEYPGFIDKATWLNPADETEIIFVIRWETREQWKAIPIEELAEITLAFDTAFSFDYEMTEEKEYIPHIQES
ncbi:MAG: TIGR03792 family protein [Cyanobacteria bacterium P01_A01_bin.114]